MFKKTQNEATALQEAIDSVLEEMKGFTADTPEYAAMTDQLTKLYNLKVLDTPKGVSKDTLAMIGGNLAGIVMILGHERAHVVASKALSFVMKLK